MTMSAVPLIYSGRVRRAIQLAEQAHRGVNRKSGDHPYFLHLVSVTQLLMAAGADDDLLCAGYLHDIVEDTSWSMSRLEDEFGQRVAFLVGAVTKQSVDPDGEKISKEDKHRVTEEKMAAADADTAALKAADLTANISDLVLDHAIGGYSHWQEVFGSRDKADFKVAHYLRLADILIGRLSYHAAYPVLAELLRKRATDLRDLYASWER
jgi:(p)ppGpp synthase/HD superfamily hydrolase